MFYVTKRGGSPYSGPTWERSGITPSFFDTEEEARIVANILTSLNPAGFSVESIEESHPGYVPCKVQGYPRMMKL